MEENIKNTEIIDPFVVWNTAKEMNSMAFRKWFAKQICQFKDSPEMREYWIEELKDKFKEFCLVIAPPDFEHWFKKLKEGK